MAPTGNTAFVNDFIGAGYVVDRADAVVIHKSGKNEADNIYWKYGHDATSAVQIKISRSHFTKNKLSIEKMERRDYRLHVGQKIGIVVYRDFVVTAEVLGCKRIPFRMIILEVSTVMRIESTFTRDKPLLFRPMVQ